MFTLCLLSNPNEQIVFWWFFLFVCFFKVALRDFVWNPVMFKRFSYWVKQEHGFLLSSSFLALNCFHKPHFKE